MRTALLVATFIVLAGCRNGPGTDNSFRGTTNAAGSTEVRRDANRFKYIPAPYTRFERLTAEDGLSYSSVNAIFQDDQGYMWFGTPNGLNRFDGHNFIRFSRDADFGPELKDDYILSIYEDSKRNLWIGT